MVTESGWYGVEIVTTQDRIIKSDECKFDAQAKLSHAISMAHLDGAGTSLSMWGYGEKMPRSEIAVPFIGDHWWYPQQTFWTIQTHFHGENRTLQGGGNKSALDKFRPSKKSS